MTNPITTEEILSVLLSQSFKRDISPAVQHAVERCRATPENTKRYRQRAIAAGRQYLAELFFKARPDLKGNFHKLTAALRAGRPDFDFDDLNLCGAKALGLL